MKTTFTTHSIVVEMPLNTRTKRQRARLAELLKSGEIESAAKYTASFHGKTHRWLEVPDMKTDGTDNLADKRDGSVQSLFDRMLNTGSAHQPSDQKTTWIGVEIECLVPFGSVSEDADATSNCPSCEGTGIGDDPDGESDSCCRCEGTGRVLLDDDDPQFRAALAELVRAEKITRVNVKDDGSLRTESGFFPVELTCLTRLDRPDNLKRLCELLNRIGAKVNKSCGMHVHLDARHLTAVDVKRIGRKFGHSLPVLAAMVPPTRRTNRYCSLSVSGLRGDRYHAVNLTAFRKYKTIEIRLHSSTTSFEKIIHWATLLTGIAKAQRIPRVVHDLNELTDFVKIPESTLEYCTQRTALFSPESTCAAAFRDTDSTDIQTEIGA